MEVVVLPMSPAAMSETILSRHTSAYLSAPGSPRQFGGHPSHFSLYGASAPASPSRISAAVFQELSNWEDEEEEEEEKHDKSAAGDHGGDSDWEPFDFANGFSGQLDKDGRPAVPDIATADELFERGVIRPLILQAGRGNAYEPNVRGRASGASLSDAVFSRSRRVSRSLSPVRGVGGAEKEYFFEAASMQSTTGASAADPSLVKGGGGSKKWRLMNMFLFRSASEGRATGRGSKDPLCRFSIPCSSSSTSPSSLSFLPSLFRKKRATTQEDAINAGPRPAGSTTRRGRKTSSTTTTASVHAMHLAASRAASEEMKKKAPLPYHPNALFGYLRHNAAIQTISRQFISSS